jgi:hypothetical protein
MAWGWNKQTNDNSKKSGIDIIKGWNNQPVEIVRSPGGSQSFVDYRDGLISQDVSPWPPPELAQKLFASEQVKHFSTEDEPKLTHNLGYYCDLQSINSEDALTWNVFGLLNHTIPSSRDLFSHNLIASLGFESRSIQQSHIWVWRRLPHPDTIGGNGPELDFAIQTPETVILGECKWHGALSKGQGIAKNLDQIEIRQRFCERVGRGIFPEAHRFIVLGVTIEGDLVEESVTHSSGIEYRTMNSTWQDIIDLAGHPYSEELGRLLKWKIKHGGAGRSLHQLSGRLGIKPSTTITFLNDPPGWVSQFDMPDGVRTIDNHIDHSDSVIMFAANLQMLTQSLGKAESLFRQGGQIWIAWPLRSGSLRSDIGKNDVIDAAHKIGLVNVKNTRLDHRWTAIKFFRRKCT